MQSLKLYSLCSKLAATTLQRQLQTSAIASTRKINPDFVNLNKRRRKVVQKDFDQYVQEIQNEGEDEDEDVNFMHLDEYYDKHKRELQIKKSILDKIITKEKYFKKEKQPTLLTHQEKQTMKYLHETDPEKWDINTLSESFPALPETVKKILKSKWKASPEKMKKMDLAVAKNWELLAEGNLRGDPELIKHAKKFVNRRKVLLEQIQNANLYVKEEKKEQFYNNGEMSSILTHYEKSIDMIHRQHSLDMKTNSLTNKMEEKIDYETTKKQKSSLDDLQKRIDEEVLIQDVKGDEFMLDKPVGNSEKEITLKQLEESVLNKAEVLDPLSLVESAILEAKLRGSRSNEENSQYEVPKYNPKEEKEAVRRNQRNLLQNESNVHDEQLLISKDTEGKQRVERKKKSINEIDEDNGKVIKPDERTCFISEIDLGKKLNLDGTSNPQLVNEINVVSKKKKIWKFETDPAVAESDRLFYEQQENDIKFTPFWSSGRSSKEKELAEQQKGSLREAKDPSEITKADVSSNDVYPERIKIPKSQRGSGLTFKIKDCYYDDDGEFLYRVPGMKN